MHQLFSSSSIPDDRAAYNPPLERPQEVLKETTFTPRTRVISCVVIKHHIHIRNYPCFGIQQEIIDNQTEDPSFQFIYIRCKQTMIFFLESYKLLIHFTHAVHARPCRQMIQTKETEKLTQIKQSKGMILNIIKRGKREELTRQRQMWLEFEGLRKKLQDIESRQVRPISSVHDRLDITHSLRRRKMVGRYLKMFSEYL